MDIVVPSGLRIMLYVPIYGIEYWLYDLGRQWITQTVELRVNT
jgi:hypothetical protein